MNKELIEILTCIRTWSIKNGGCKGKIGELEIANKCDFKCALCPVFQTRSLLLYTDQIISIPLN
jgi:hypothetical protein|nr:MAG TPA: Radical SAM superfamily [Caudoviricetes sp.]